MVILESLKLLKSSYIRFIRHTDIKAVKTVIKTKDF